MGCSQSTLHEEALDGLDASRNGRVVSLKKPVKSAGDTGADDNTDVEPAPAETGDTK
eukprot:CAMPEP_0194130686 /NCGR_PEP_ID=MMETSP0152-20130528/1674_1 /TAXON_ID=1049557 /ORGANISM="Thalassiothrix antarctica, Strain L6-D1" /LENGTH=56 /DNA_ID=CAMNT_0038825279 /DNA_START=97 /DNA_END=267 /DNA_ORIENTATION=+